jgi:3-oxoacyl-[acyl-carrier-protein] synthase-3
MFNQSVGIIGTGKYLPERILTNHDLEKIVETNDEWIKTRTGISERRIASPDQAASDLAVPAALQALEKANITADQLDLIIVATVTPDMAFPSTASIVQERIGAKKAAAFDLSAACSGFIYALANGRNFISGGMGKYVLVIGVEVLSRITDYQDRATCILFGDGAGAAVLGEVPGERGFKSFELGSDGSGADLLKVCGGSRNPLSQELLDDRKNFIYMAGNEVFKFAVRVMGSAAEAAVEKAGFSKSDVDLLVPHQANIRIIQSAMDRLELPVDKCMINLEKYGNMSAASIPVALCEAVEQGRVNEGDVLVFVGFGGGLTWGATCLVW